MINRDDETDEWKEAGAILVSLMKSQFDRGSMGVSDFVHNVSPIWHRYQSGERTAELLTTIQSLNKESKK